MDRVELPGIVAGERWAEVLRHCLAAPGAILALGGTDVGKTSLCRWLSYRLSEAGTVAVIDADLGQSRIGPPTAVGLRVMGQPGSHFCFAGDTSPARCPAATLSALSRILRLARDASEACKAGEACKASPDWLIVDTSGWVLGEAAEDLKLAKIELLRPRHVLAVQSSGELASILRAIPAGLGATCHRLTSSERAVARNARLRAQWRRDRFAHFLEGAGEHWLPLTGKAVTHLPVQGEARSGQLVALEDEDGVGICLGVLQGFDDEGERVRLLCPAEGTDAAGIHFGNVWLDAHGREAAEPATDCP